MDENCMLLIEAVYQRKENEWTPQCMQCSGVLCDSYVGLSQAVFLNGSNLIVPFEKQAFEFFL